MSEGYKVATDRTANFAPPPPMPLDYANSQLYAPDFFARSYSNATGVALRTNPLGASFDVDLAINVPNSYPQSLIEATPRHGRTSRNESFLRIIPNSGQPHSEEAKVRLMLASPLSTIAVRSAETRPAIERITSEAWTARNWSDTIFAEWIVAIGDDGLASDKAKEQLSMARAAACANEMRLAYRHLYRGLDFLLRRGKWRRVSTELEEVCSQQYPAAFGIGAMRFSSEAAQRIPRWNAILKKLAETARLQGIDVRKAMRGLVETNGAT
jgi:hypothetical protein